MFTCARTQSSPATTNKQTRSPLDPTPPFSFCLHSSHIRMNPSPNPIPTSVAARMRGCLRHTPLHRTEGWDDGSASFAHTHTQFNHFARTPLPNTTNKQQTNKVSPRKERTPYFSFCLQSRRIRMNPSPNPIPTSVAARMRGCLRHLCNGTEGWDDGSGSFERTHTQLIAIRN